MDKKNTLIGVGLLIFAFGLMFYQGTRPRPAQPAPAQAAPQFEPQDAAPPPAGAPIATPGGHAQVEADGERAGETIYSLENAFIEARFTNYGGAVKEIVLKQVKRSLDADDPYVMNRLRYAPALNLLTSLGGGSELVYESVATGSRERLEFRAQLTERIEVVRRYAISQDETGAAPYTIEHQIVFRNLGGEPVAIGDLRLNLGTVAPSGNQDAQLQTFGYYDGDDVEFIEQSDFRGSSMPFFSRAPSDFKEGSAHIVWASVKNQFFLTLLTPEQPVGGFVARPVDFPADIAGGPPKTGLTGDVKIGAVTVPANGETALGFSYFAGPKEHDRLAKLDQGQEKAVQFGFFGIIAKFLLLILNGIQGYVDNWGVAIILLTIVVRSVLLPINLLSMRSMRKMSKLQEPMKLVKERFPDNPQKQQQMMLELYKLNKINPVAGCVPMLAQIPIFFALFYMLRGAAELRFADFLWIQDLSQPDTVATIPGVPFLGDFPLNVLPFFWLVSLAYQMWTMPAPTVDNAQMKLMKFMPFIFFPFTYTFSSGLVLYWTVSNVFTIGQQWLMKRNEPQFEVQLPASLKKAIDAPAKGKSKRRR